jgi:tRNA(His) 5'-end guanylyltransferase
MLDRKSIFRKAEQIQETRVNPLTPCVIRVDGRAFSKLTKGMAKPFDPEFIKAMDVTAKFLAENVSDCVLAYVQSDEISLVLRPTENPWFDWRIEKLTSVTASMASVTFAFAIQRAAFPATDNAPAYIKAASMCPTFDSRVLSLPADKIADYLIWRQSDATRNAISQAAYTEIGPKATKSLNTSQMQEALFQKGINFNDYAPRIKRGAVVRPVSYEKEGFNPMTGETVPCTRTRWELDEDTPVFVREPSYLQALLDID